MSYNFNFWSFLKECFLAFYADSVENELKSEFRLNFLFKFLSNVKQPEMKTAFVKFVVSLSVVGIFTAFAYFYPRFLVSSLGENSPWISYLYTYGMGFIFFSSSLIFIFTRSIHALRRRREFYWLIVVSVGFVFMFFCQGFWIYLAIHFPIKS